MPRTQSDADGREAPSTGREASSIDARARRAARTGVVAIIPARGGSKGIPGKNLASVGGAPLVVRAIRAALAAAAVDRVVVSTDDDAIAAAAHAAGAWVVERPAELAGDTAPSEQALLHALDRLALAGVDPELIVFVQATSPFIDPADLDRAVARVVRGEVDSVFSAVESHAFLWRAVGETRATADGPTALVDGVNHDPAQRPRRQDRTAEYRETGAFYVLRTAGFRAAGHRFFGRVGVQPVPEAHALEIDAPAELALAEAIAPTLDARAAWRAAPDVDAVVTDFDGVHTDDSAIVGVDGHEVVRVSRRDGAGIARLRDAGVPVLILSAEQHPVVGARAAKLGVEVLQGVSDKGAALAEWAARRGIRLDRLAYLGNDLGDLPALALAGWPVAVADADPAVRRAARLVLSRRGGDGAVRELADAVLDARADGRAPSPALEEPLPDHVNEGA
jgi:YrbI family 3-deoxy-D-manno-octulosonate 8-phosphate phosphatase